MTVPILLRYRKNGFWPIVIDSHFSYTQSVPKLLQHLLLSILILLIACQQKPDPRMLVLARTGEIKSFDPALAVDVRSGQIIALTYDNLVHFGNSTELVPGIAEIGRAHV